MSEMSKRTIKFKLNNQKSKAEKIYFPSSFNELYDKAENFFKNIKPPDKIFQIIDMNLNKIIKDQNDFITFISDHSSENSVKLLLNITDIKDINKIPHYQVENSSIFFQSIIVPKKEEEISIEEEKEKKKELTEDEKMKESIRALVQSKLKILESKLYNEIKNSDQPIHNGIKCNLCGTNNIRGIRYKCSICDNYNLCEKCEENSNHDEDHILLKLRKPLSESELNQKISSSALFRNDFSVEPDYFELRKNDLINVKRITLYNTGNLPFKKGFWFKCIKEKSTIVGNDIKIEGVIKPGESKSLEIIYEKENLDCRKEEYYTSYKLIDEKSKQIGKIHTFSLKLI